MAEGAREHDAGRVDDRGVEALPPSPSRRSLPHSVPSATARLGARRPASSTKSGAEHDVGIEREDPVSVERRIAWFCPPAKPRCRGSPRTRRRRHAIARSRALVLRGVVDDHDLVDGGASARRPSRGSARRSGARPGDHGTDDLVRTDGHAQAPVPSRPLRGSAGERATGSCATPRRAARPGWTSNTSAGPTSRSSPRCGSRPRVQRDAHGVAAAPEAEIDVEGASQHVAGRQSSSGTPR